MRILKFSALALSVVVGSCTDARQPTAPLTPEGARVARTIDDGAHHGNAHFFFLPPLVAQPRFTGESDATQSPTVMVCEWISDGGHCGAVVAAFGRGNGSSPDEIIYDANTGVYQVDWKTDQCVTGPCTLDPARTYRLRVLVGAYELGHADFDVVSSGKELKNVDTGEYIGLVAGRTLPVKFRIEQSAVVAVKLGSATKLETKGGVLVTEDGSVALVFPEGALSSTTEIAVSASTATLPGGEWSIPIELGPNGTTFEKPVTLTLRYDDRKLPIGVPASALAIFTWTDGGWEEVPGSVVDPSINSISAPITHFSIYWIYIRPNRFAPTGDLSNVTMFVGQSVELTIRVAYQANSQEPEYAVAGLRVTWDTWDLARPAAAAQFAAPAYSITDANGETTSPPLNALAPGKFRPGGLVGSCCSFGMFEMTVLPMPVASVMVDPSTVSLSLTAPSNQQQLTATLKDANGNVLSGRPIAWRSSDEAVAKVDASGLVASVASGTATITATSEGQSGTAQISVSSPGTIWVSSNSIALSVQQGQTTSKEIFVDGAQGSVVTNLSTGPFWNTITGALAPWMTASLSATTSPSKLTITAAPSLTTEASSYQFSFAIFSPGATNSPYVIYSVYVTVIAADVTPTGATISPSAAGLSMTATQGGSGSAQMTIANGGSGTLSGLAASPLSNYYTGADAPWVTASFNTTTAPATLTVTARPTFSIAPGDYKLRFEITAPGASNSPLTIYSVDVRVVEGVPSPTLLFIGSPLVACCYNDVYTQRLDGSERTRLTNTPMAGEFRPRWSPDGTKIVFDRGGVIFRMNADGSAFETLTSGADASYSPDGTEIVFGRGYKIWIMNADGTNQRQLSFTAGRDEGTPSIARDGTIVFAANDAAGQSIYMRDPVTAEETPLTDDRVSTYASFSPDGAKILYNSGKNIYTMDRDGGNKTLLSYDSSVNGGAIAPTWSPDGKTIALKGPQGFYVMTADGAALKLLPFPSDMAQTYPSIRPGRF